MTDTVPPDLWKRQNWSVQLEPTTHPHLGYLLVVVGLLIAWNFVGNEVIPALWAALLSLLGMAVLLAVARSAGVSWDYLGLSRGSLRRGIEVGLVGVGVVVGAVVIAAALPVTREVFADDRFVGVGVGEMLYESLIRVPFGTALTEEIAFRGVLLGLLLTRMSVVRAALVSSVFFGLWHILPGLDALETSTIDDFGDGFMVAVAGVSVQVLATALAGGLFVWLRFRGRHLITPILVHWAINSAAYVAGWLIVRNSWA